MTQLVNENLTAKRKAKFLEAFALTGVIRTGCEASGVSRSAYKYWRKSDEDFAEACVEAYENAVDGSEIELRKRGIEGVEDVVLFKGEPVWRRNPDGSLELDDDFDPVPFTRFTRSDRLLEVYTRSHRPIYKEKTEIAVTGADGGPLRSTIRIEFVDPKREEDDPLE